MTRKTRRTDLLVVLIALVVRGAVLLAMRDSLANDPDGYRMIAENVLREGEYARPDRADVNNPLAKIYPTAYRPPLYPLVLTKVARGFDVWPLGVGLLHWFLGIATVALVIWLGRAWRLEQFGWLAAFLVACDPITLQQSSQVMTETLATFLSVVCLCCLTRFDRRRDWWTAGLVGGSIALAILCRPTFLPWLPLVVLVALWQPVSRLRRVANTATILVIAAIVLAPWPIRNYRELRRPIFTTTHGGYTLLLGNNPEFYTHLREAPWGTVWNAPADLLDRLNYVEIGDGELSIRVGGGSRVHGDELRDDDVANDIARRSIREEPWMFVYACFDRIVQLWNPLPHQVADDESLSRRLLRYAVAVWYVAIFAAAVCGIRALRWSVVRTPWLWGVLLCLVFTGAHTFYWSNLRMRAPLMPFVCLLAAAGVRGVVEWQRVKRERQINAAVV